MFYSTLPRIYRRKTTILFLFDTPPSGGLPAVGLMLSGLECRGLFLVHLFPPDASGYMHFTLSKDYAHLR